MRRMPLFILAAALAGCTTAPPPASRTAEGQEKLTKLLAGKVAGQPTECLPSFRQNDMVVIDESTIAFREGAGRVYVNRVIGACNGVGHSGYALVTNSFGGGRLCRGDIARVMDVQNGTTIGSCALGDFVPYTRA